MHLSGKLDFSKLSVRNNQTVELQYSSTDLEDYHQRLSNIKLDHNPVSIDDELVELYLEVSVVTDYLTLIPFKRYGHLIMTVHLSASCYTVH